jgi:hypothetical protein
MSEEIEREALRTRWRALHAERLALESRTRELSGSGDVNALHTHALRLHDFHARLHQLTVAVDEFHVTYGHAVRFSA